MKQKEIYIDPSLNLETQKMVEMYLMVKNVNGIEGFIHSEEEFLKKYKNSYMINDLRSARFYAIYQVDHCGNCGQSYGLVISSRSQFQNHLSDPYKLCSTCKIYQSSTENNLGYSFE